MHVQYIFLNILVLFEYIRMEYMLQCAKYMYSISLLAYWQKKYVLVDAQSEVCKCVQW